MSNSFFKNLASITLAAATAAAAGTGCASRADVIEVRNTQVQMRAALADQNQDIEELKRRYEAVRTQVADPNKGRSGQTAATTDHLLRLIEDLNRRVAMLEQGAPAGAPPVEGMPGEPIPNVVPPLGQTSGAAPLPTPAPARNPMQAALAREEAALQGSRPDPAYSAGLQQIRDGDCKAGITSMREYIRKNPKSQLADNAQYWIGACFYQQKDPNRAITELYEVLMKYPKGDKVPAAFLLLADAFTDLGQPIDARLILQKLIDEHPNTEEAQQGKAKLRALGN